MIDTHAHLDACDAEPAELLARARAAGVARVVTIGTGIDSCRRALAIAESEPGVVAALGIDPHHAATTEADRLDELPGRRCWGDSSDAPRTSGSKIVGNASGGIGRPAL